MGWRWVRRMVAQAQLAAAREEVDAMRSVLHGVFGLQIRRAVNDWESAGMVREEVLSILRETYNDLAPKTEQWGVGPAPVNHGSLLPGQSPPHQYSHGDIAAIVRAELARATGPAPSKEPPPEEKPPNAPLPPPPPGQGPGYPLTNLPSLAELQAQIDKRRAAGEK